VSAARTQEFMTVPEVAEVLRFPQQQVRLLCQSGRIPGAVRIGRRWRISRTRLFEAFGLEEG
jgi:excisionase family DNA binding protein